MSAIKITSKALTRGCTDHCCWCYLFTVSNSDPLVDWYLERAPGHLLVTEVDVGVVDTGLRRLEPDSERVVLHRFGGDRNVSTARVGHRQTDVACSHEQRLAILR